MLRVMSLGSGVRVAAIAAMALVVACAGSSETPNAPVPVVPVPVPVPVPPAAPLGWPTAPEWNGTGGSAAHLRYVPVTIDVTKLRELWNRGDSVSYAIAFTSTIDSLAIGVVRTYGDTAYLVAVNVLTGAIRWRAPSRRLYEADRGMMVGATYRTVMVGEDGAKLVSIDPRTGASIRETTMDRYRLTFDLTVLADSDAIYASGEPFGELARFDAITDAPSVRFDYFGQFAPQPASEPALRDSVIVAFKAGPHVEPLERIGLNVWHKRTGKLLHSTNAELAFIENIYTPAVTPDAIYGIVLGRLRRYNRSNGAEVWHRDRCDKKIAVTPDAVYAICDATVLALRPTDGFELWSWPLPAGSYAIDKGFLATDNVLFVSGGTGTVALGLSTHAVVWSSVLDAADFVVSPLGVVLARSRNGRWGWMALAGN